MLPVERGFLAPWPSKLEGAMKYMITLSMQRADGFTRLKGMRFNGKIFLLVFILFK